MDRGAAPTRTEAVSGVYLHCPEMPQHCNTPTMAPFFPLWLIPTLLRSAGSCGMQHPPHCPRAFPGDSASPCHIKLNSQPQFVVDREENSQTLPSKSRAFNLCLINRVTHLFPTMWGLVGCADRSHQCQGALLSPGSGQGHGLVTPRSPCDDRVRRASAAATACRWGTPTSSFTLSLTGTASRAPQSCASNCAARARPRTSPSSWWGTKPTWCGAVRCLKKVSRG